MRICDADQQKAVWFEETVLHASNEQCDYTLSSQKMYFITFNIIYHNTNVKKYTQSLQAKQA